MNLDRIDQIAKAVLYEGYMLYPYRPSSVKNRQRWNFGVLYPPAYSEAQGGVDACRMTTECLINGTVRTTLELRLRFLQLQVRSTSESADATSSHREDWQEAVDRDISVPVFPLESALIGPVTHKFQLPAETIVDSEPSTNGVSAITVVRQQSEVQGELVITCQQIREDLLKVRVEVSNTTPPTNADANRDDALLHSLISAHTVLSITNGEFISLLEPPAEVQEYVAQCQNVGAWPVLVGEPGQLDTLLASPIILYDYPQIAPESAGDLFDGTEIDEILSLRIMTLTDDEKREIRESDERAREILDRTDAMPAEQFMKLHGAVRGLRPLKESTP